MVLEAQKAPTRYVYNDFSDFGSIWPSWGLLGLDLGLLGPPGFDLGLLGSIWASWASFEPLGLAVSLGCHAPGIGFVLQAWLSCSRHGSHAPGVPDSIWGAAVQVASRE